MSGLRHVLQTGQMKTNGLDLVVIAMVMLHAILLSS